MKGCICLDIDGTITADPFSIPEPVLECFEDLYKRGWSFLFSTGRPYAFAYRVLKNISFPFFLSLQNGADVLQMPEKKLLFKSHLGSSFIPELDALYEKKEEDFLVYSGFELGDFCYYRPHRFSEKMTQHLKIVQSVVQEPWKAVEEFSFSLTDSFPLIKSLGTKEEMEHLNKQLISFPQVHSTLILDPLSRGEFYLTLITADQASKGNVIRKIREKFDKNAFFIAAGDDHNDHSMLEEADYAIVMGTAPESLFSLADYIADSAKNLGIIKALWQATGEIE